MITLFPEHTTNPNVPSNVFLIYEHKTMSGEIKETCYADHDGYTFLVGDWKGDKPIPQTMSQITRITYNAGYVTDAYIERAFLQWHKCVKSAH